MTEPNLAPAPAATDEGAEDGTATQPTAAERTAAAAPGRQRALKLVVTLQAAEAGYRAVLAPRRRSRRSGGSPSR